MRKFALKTVVLFILTGLMYACVQMKPNTLFVDSNSPSGTDTLFYISSEIYHDFYSSEAWNTHQVQCISVKAVEEATFEGDLGLHIKWDRQAEGCPWLGMGFGWDNWTGKDLSSIKNEGAIEFWVRMIEGERSNLPWAIGFEDFTGAQAWLGMTSNAIKADKITTEWTRIELPLSEFNWAEQDADATSIKQIIFQMEADGEIYMDEIQIVPYTGGYRKRAYIPVISADQFNVDAEKNDAIWTMEEILVGNSKVHLALLDSFLCIAMETKDDTPLENVSEGDNSFEGDAFELAFSTDPDAVLQRVRYLSSDQHIGFSLGNEVRAWDWTKHRALKKIKSATSKTTEGYIFEAMLNLNELEVKAFLMNTLYGLEVVVDEGNNLGRVEQFRWNDPANGGFYENPFLWGEMMFYNQAKSPDEL